MKEIWGRSLWLYQGHYLLSYSCFLIFFFLFLMTSLAPLLFLLLHRCHYLYGIQSSALLQFKNSFLLLHDNSTSFHCDFFLRRISCVILFHGIQSYAKIDSWINGTNCCPRNRVTCDKCDHHVIALQKNKK